MKQCCKLNGLWKCIFRVNKFSIQCYAFQIKKSRPSRSPNNTTKNKPCFQRTGHFSKINMYLEYLFSTLLKWCNLHCLKKQTCRLIKNWMFNQNNYCRFSIFGTLFFFHSAFRFWVFVIISLLFCFFFWFDPPDLTLNKQ